jgi:hypothetical protein
VLNLFGLNKRLIMKKLNVCLSIILLSSLFSSVAGAQDEAAETGLVFTPIEIFICNYKKGKGPEHLDKVIADWNKWMDDTGAEPYSAWIYTSFYNSPDYDFDVAWLGVWPDGKSMGKGTDQWLADGGEQADAFAKVMTCPLHANFASTELRGGPSENADSAVLEFSDCKFKEDAKFADAMSAASDWNAYMTAQGSVGSEWFFFPVYGSDPEWHFKQVNAYPNHAELGADYDRYGNGAGYVKAQELHGDTYTCGVSRIYNSKRVRAGLPQQSQE